jgi:hypothetical protein
MGRVVITLMDTEGTLDVRLSAIVHREEHDPDTELPCEHVARWLLLQCRDAQEMFKRNQENGGSELN